MLAVYFSRETEMLAVYFSRETEMLVVYFSISPPKRPLHLGNNAFSDQ